MPTPPEPIPEIPAQPILADPEAVLETVNLGEELEARQAAYLEADTGEGLEPLRLAFVKREFEAKIQTLDHALEVERTMLEQRKRYALRLFQLSAVWLIFIGAYLVLAGLGKLKVADSVLIALISTTTANVLGLFYIVARWLFPNRNDNLQESKNKDA